MADITNTTQEIIKLKQAAKDPNERHQRMNTQISCEREGICMATQTTGALIAFALSSAPNHPL